MTPVGLEPTVSGSVGRRLIHWATGPVEMKAFQHVRIKSILVEDCKLKQLHKWPRQDSNLQSLAPWATYSSGHGACWYESCAKILLSNLHRHPLIRFFKLEQLHNNSGRTCSKIKFVLADFRKQNSKSLLLSMRWVRFELTTLGLWDLRAANCAITATQIRDFCFDVFMVMESLWRSPSLSLNAFRNWGNYIIDPGSADALSIQPQARRDCKRVALTSFVFLHTWERFL